MGIHRVRLASIAPVLGPEVPLDPSRIHGLGRGTPCCSYDRLFSLQLEEGKILGSLRRFFLVGGWRGNLDDVIGRIRIFFDFISIFIIFIIIHCSDSQP
ncbi:hypothetical protein ASPBRDRAFT_562875 [Aspergillus brasiliensis CBS 101740]|uniref:Uncharacterized protein n=1 Tax=Aspergillus brasiliensis (strain CBS 101740 / IMI 381727 / IBT 21946) TaxID=767769 RepID=A0A1L9UMW6_ASPBC|nr:hypothetical protein ASPBRDRAFT_562875 [Aspergillus brasiliensis CBS 101740]